MTRPLTAPLTPGAEIAVLYGGWSAEREVSLVSGRAVADALIGAGLSARLIDVPRDPRALLAALDPAPVAVFNALHGKGGEDGTIQGLLDLAGLPYTHSGVLASAVAMSKPLTKQLLAAEGILSPQGMVVSAESLADGHPMMPPYIVKPADEGSSVGVHLVHDGSNSLAIAADRAGLGEQVLVEEYIAGRELTVGVMGDRALMVTEIRHDAGLFDYRAKYVAGHAEHLLPAPVPDAVREAALAAALTAHRALGCHGISRSDFRYDPERPTGRDLFFLEINTQPGFTPISLVPEQAAYAGIAFADLCLWLLEDAVCRA
jgi:D-alanine-D-alanine ligase